jgi:hypothetical protein
MASSGKMPPQIDSASLLTLEDFESPITALCVEGERALHELELSCSPQLQRTDSTTLTGQKRSMNDECTQDDFCFDDDDEDGFTTPKVTKREPLAPGAPKKKR